MSLHCEIQGSNASAPEQGAATIPPDSAAGRSTGVPRRKAVIRAERLRPELRGGGRPQRLLATISQRLHHSQTAHLFTLSILFTSLR